MTRKSTEVTKEVVTKQLKTSFNSELGKFHFTHVEVELQEAGGERGALYHKLILRRAPGVELPKVVSAKLVGLGLKQAYSFVAFGGLAGWFWGAW